MSLADQTWTLASACDGADLGAFFPDKGESGAAAKAVCASCPVIRSCAVDSVTRSKVHYASADGIRAGMGGALRRGMIRAAADCDHNPLAECHDPACAWCRTFSAHLDALQQGARLCLNVNGDGAVHGRKSTGARGCTCPPCRLARSTVGQRLAEHTDVVAWWSWLLAPIPDQVGQARHETADWVELDRADADEVLERVKHAALATLRTAA